ncbi:TPR repeat-containing protein (plasmid) [Nostoc sp. NIES-4103]|nr:TPR repeat-containing protein [Nostoc sp. NIES-4103]
MQNSDRLITLCKVAEGDEGDIPALPGIPLNRQGFSDVVVNSDRIVRRHLLASQSVLLVYMESAIFYYYSLMTEFYRNWQQQPDKAAALRQAMLVTMKQHPHPRDWAAFTIIGEAK